MGEKFVTPECLVSVKLFYKPETRGCQLNCLHFNPGMKIELIWSFTMTLFHPCISSDVHLCKFGTWRMRSIIDDGITDQLEWEMAEQMDWSHFYLVSALEADHVCQQGLVPAIKDHSLFTATDGGVLHIPALCLPHNQKGKHTNSQTLFQMLFYNSM